MTYAAAKVEWDQRGACLRRSSTHQRHLIRVLFEVIEECSLYCSKTVGLTCRVDINGDRGGGGAVTAAVAIGGDLDFSSFSELRHGGSPSMFTMSFVSNSTENVRRSSRISDASYRRRTTWSLHRIGKMLLTTFSLLYFLQKPQFYFIQVTSFFFSSLILSIFPLVLILSLFFKFKDYDITNNHNTGRSTHLPLVV